MHTYMKRNHPLNTFLKTVGCSLSAASLTVNAASLDISNVPLFAATNAPPPNIMFIFDDSGSMDWGTVTEESNGLFYVDGCALAYTHPAPADDHYRDPSDDDGNFKDYDNYYPVPPESANSGKGFWRARTHHYNKLYYNPGITYQPWAGSDSNGTPYTDANPSAALVNPYYPALGTFNLTSNTTYYSLDGFGCQNPGFAAQTTYNPARYWEWNDTDNDGNVDIGEKGSRVDVSSSMGARTGAIYENRIDCIQDEDPGDIDTTDGFPTCTGAQEIQNFANWFQYHRRREFTAKYAYTSVVNDSTGVKMGLVTLHNNNNVKKELTLMSVDANKDSLLDSLSDINANGGTPLRTAVYNAGEYLSCDSNSHFNSCPSATVAEGGACQQNFMIAMTDGFYNGSFDMPGSSDNEDGNNDTSYDGGPYADNYEDTLADVAMEFYENDIHPTLANVLPIIPGIDEASHQHVTTYTVAFGVNGTLTAMPPLSTNGTSFWPDPQENTSSAIPEKIDDLRHAAFNGRGLFLSASSPDELTTALSDTILSIGDRASSAAAVALNSSSLNSETHVFQARFDSGDWSGQLLSFPVSDGSGTGLCAGKAIADICDLEWDAGQIIKTQNWNTEREIITTDNSNSAGTGIPFRWPDFNGSQKTDLKTHPDSLTRSTATLSNNNGKKLWRYIRGRSYDGMRVRSSPLGDIINSDPYFVKYGSNSGVVFVGSNDGMMHAFSEANGKELFAFIPGDRRVWDNLTTMASLSYNTKHRYYVDGSPTAGKATVDGAQKTVLVSGLRAGGQSMFALNITDPSKFDEAFADELVEWEFTDEDDPQLGFTYSQPSIVQMENNKWAAIIGNGYNNTDPDGYSSSDGKGALFILYLDGPDGSGDWTGKYKRIDVNYGSTTTPNGLATPVPIDTDNNGKVDYIYAGDLAGNLWRFDVNDSNDSNWVVGLNGDPLFVASTDGSTATSKRQPITVRPEVGAHFKGISHGVIVMFGTGKYIETGDNSSAGQQTQTFYGVWDKLGNIPVGTRSSSMVQQSITTEVVPAGGCSQTDPCFRIVSDNTTNLVTGGDNGWYLDLINTGAGTPSNGGERSVSNPILRGGRIIFTTLIPSGSVCEFGGDGWLMELDMFTGGQPDVPVLDTNGDGKIDAADIVNGVPPAGIQYGNGILARPTLLSIPPADGSGGPVDGLVSKKASTSSGNIDNILERDRSDRRLTWREIR